MNLLNFIHFLSFGLVFIMFPRMKVDGFYPQEKGPGLRYNDAEYMHKLSQLPDGFFSATQLHDLNLFAMEKPLTAKKNSPKYPTTYIPAERFHDFYLGESYRGSNPLDPNDHLFVITKTEKRAPSKKDRRTLVHKNTPNTPAPPPALDDHVATEVVTTEVSSKAEARDHTTDLSEPKKASQELPPHPYYRTFGCTHSPTCKANFSTGPPITSSSGMELVCVRFKWWRHVGHCTSYCESLPGWDMEKQLPCPEHNKPMHPPKLDVFGARPKSISKACENYLRNELVKYPHMNPKHLIKSWINYSHSFNPPPIVAGYPILGETTT